MSSELPGGGGVCVWGGRKYRSVRGAVMEEKGLFRTSPPLLGLEMQSASCGSLCAHLPSPCQLPRAILSPGRHSRSSPQPFLALTWVKEGSVCSGGSSLGFFLSLRRRRGSPLVLQGAGDPGTKPWEGGHAMGYWVHMATAGPPSRWWNLEEVSI